MLPSATYKSIKLCTQRHFIGVGGCMYLREVQLDVGSQNDCERHQRASHPVVFLGKIAPDDIQCTRHHFLWLRRLSLLSPPPSSVLSAHLRRLSHSLCPRPRGCYLISPLPLTASSPKNTRPIPRDRHHGAFKIE